MAQSYGDGEKKPDSATQNPKALEHIKRLRMLESERTTIEGVWEIIERFVAPYRGEFYRDLAGENSVDWSNRDIFDSTAIMAAQVLSANMHANLTSPSAKWFTMGYRDPSLHENVEARRWIESSSDKTYQAIQSSNFNLETAELYQDLSTLGTGCVIEDEITTPDGDYEALTFTSAGIKEIFFEDGFDGQPVRFYRKLKWAPAKLVSKFGIENVPEKVQKAYHAGVQDRFDVLFAVWRRFDKVDNPFAIVDPLERAYGYCYYMIDSATPLGEEGGYYEMPAFIARWRTTSESRWGNSPAMVALPDILTLNELKMLVLRANEKVIDPTIFAEERALIGDLDLGPAGYNVVRRINSIQPFESGARFDVSAMSEANLRDAIQRMFYIDQLQLKDAPSMTATEAQIRYEMMQRVLGPTLGRLRVDYIDKVVTRSFNIMYRAGELDEMPEVVKQARAGATIEYTGPLARAQKLDQSAAIERWVNQMAAMAQGGEEIAAELAHVPNYTEIALFSADALNVPAKLVNSRSEITAETKKRREQRDRRVAAETAQMEAQANGQNGAAQGVAGQPAT